MPTTRNLAVLIFEDVEVLETNESPTAGPLLMSPTR
jgi:hypothetical protein